MVRNVLVFAILSAIMFTATIRAQSNTEGLWVNSSATSSGLFASPDFGLEMGSSFSTGWGSPFFTQAVAPRFTFRPHQNFSWTAGTLLTRTSFGSSHIPMGGEGYHPSSFNSATLYLSGSWHVNPRFTLTGTTWGERNNSDAMMGWQMNPGAFNLNAGGMLLEMDYRITENVSFGAGINVSSGYTPYHPFFPGIHSPQRMHK